MPRFRTFAGTVFVALVATSVPARAQDPLTKKIDAEIKAAWEREKVKPGRQVERRRVPPTHLPRPRRRRSVLRRTKISSTTRRPTSERSSSTRSSPTSGSRRPRPISGPRPLRPASAEHRRDPQARRLQEVARRTDREGGSRSTRSSRSCSSARGGLRALLVRTRTPRKRRPSP